MVGFSAGKAVTDLDSTNNPLCRSQVACFAKIPPFALEEPMSPATLSFEPSNNSRRRDDTFSRS